MDKYSLNESLKSRATKNASRGELLFATASIETEEKFRRNERILTNRNYRSTLRGLKKYFWKNNFFLTPQLTLPEVS